MAFCPPSMNVLIERVGCGFGMYNMKIFERKHSDFSLIIEGGWEVNAAPSCTEAWTK